MAALPEPFQVTTVLGPLRELLGEGLSTSTSVLEQHGRDESWHPCRPPLAVAYPRSTEEVARVVELCASARVPVIPFGAGTSLEGHVSAVRGGITVDLSKMNRIVAIRHDDLDATVEAGVTHNQLNESLRNDGLFFPVDPGANATLGGMAATRASGTNAVRYGTMRENVLSLSVVLADGQVVTTSRRARKSAAGYDLTRLFVGSEGTLGVITEVTVRLYGVPEAIAAAVCSFPSLEAAAQSVIETIQIGIPVARIELIDDFLILATNQFVGTTHEVAPTLFYEFHGTDGSVAEQAVISEAVATRYGGTRFVWSRGQEERTRLWEARHAVLYSALATRPGSRAFVTDVCVPISRLADCIGDTRRDLDDASVPVGLVGHAGDGNFHLAFLIDPDNAAELAEVERINERLVMRALEMSGTCTGEHGVGLGKLGFLEAEHGSKGVDLMRTIKRSVDPLNLMNPGKLVEL